MRKKQVQELENHLKSYMALLNFNGSVLVMKDNEKLISEGVWLY